MNEEMPIITLTLDDGSILDCSVIAVFSLKENGKDYIALLPIDDQTNEEEMEADVLLYEYTELEDSNEVQLDNIEDDDEYEAVAEAFEELLDAAEDQADELDLDFEEN